MDFKLRQLLWLQCGAYCVFALDGMIGSDSGKSDEVGDSEGLIDILLHVQFGAYN